MTKMYGDKLNEKDYNTLLEIGELFSRKIFQSDLVVRAIEAGWDIRLWHTHVDTSDANVFAHQTYWKANKGDSFLASKEGDGAQQAISAMLLAIRDCKNKPAPSIL